MKFCPKCGAQNADEYKFCNSCGNQLAVTTTVNAPPPAQATQPTQPTQPVQSVQYVPRTQPTNSAQSTYTQPTNIPVQNQTARVHTSDGMAYRIIALIICAYVIYDTYVLGVFDFLPLGVRIFFLIAIAGVAVFLSIKSLGAVTTNKKPWAIIVLIASIITEIVALTNLEFCGYV